MTLTTDFSYVPLSASLSRVINSHQRSESVVPSRYPSLFVL